MRATLTIIAVFFLSAHTFKASADEVIYWLQLDATGPSPRTEHAMTFDASRNVVVLFGGISQDGSLGDTWEWDGNEWNLVATDGPSPRYRARMVYDSSIGKTVLFGGTGSACGGRCGDTWEWDGSQWTEASSSSPPKRREHAMAYDSARQEIVIHGGIDNFPIYDDTWTRSGGTWTLRTTTTPSRRVWHSMAFDSSQNKTLLFGGQPAATGRLGDTWEWNGTAWSLVATTGPAPRNHHAMFYMPSVARIVLWSGTTSNNIAIDDAWTWDGSEWTEAVQSPVRPIPRRGHQISSTQDGALLFGGQDDSGNFLSDSWLAIPLHSSEKKHWHILDGGNGHSYQSFTASTGFTWHAANQFANALGGHLATPDSQAASDWLFNHLSNSHDLWETSGDTAIGPWLGGLQDTSSPHFSEPGGGWRWVTGNYFEYSNWGPDLPSNEVPNSDFLVMFGADGSPSSQWKDYPNSSSAVTQPISFLVEWPRCPADITGSATLGHPDFGKPNGIVDADDFFVFLYLFATAHPAADMNNDGVIDADDFFLFLNLFAQGC